MAATMTPKRMLWQKTLCPLCCDCYTNPVILECGHNFCTDCIFRCWEDPDVEPTICLQCTAVVEPGSMRPNPLLGTIVDIAKQLRDQMEEAVNWGVCEIHQEPRTFFCKFDGACICVLCGELLKYRDHPVIPAAAAAEEYKAQIGTSLENLRKKKEELLASKENTEKQSRDLFGKITTERDRTVAVFRALREFLEEEENCLLAQMEEVGKEMAKKRDEDITRLSEELSSLEKTIQEMEGKCEKPPREFLKDIKGMFQRCEQSERFEIPVPFPPALKWRIWDFWEINCILENVGKKFVETLKKEAPLHKENVTLDPLTAHPLLIISRDRKCVTVRSQRQRRLEGVWTSVHYWSVLGSKPFQSGRHFWEVDVGEEEGWAVGIAVAAEQCNVDKSPGPDTSVWAIGKWQGQYWTVIHPLTPALFLNEELRKIRVSLNYTGCRVAFFDAETAAMLYTCSIHGQLSSPAYYPFFRLLSNPELRLVQ